MFEVIKALVKFIVAFIVVFTQTLALSVRQGWVMGLYNGRKNKDYVKIEQLALLDKIDKKWKGTFHLVTKDEKVEILGLAFHVVQHGLVKVHVCDNLGNRAAVIDVTIKGDIDVEKEVNKVVKKHLRKVYRVRANAHMFNYNVVKR